MKALWQIVDILFYQTVALLSARLMVIVGEKEGELGDFTWGETVDIAEEGVLDHEFVGYEVV